MTTNADLDRMFARAVHAAGHAGIAGTNRWALIHGSQTYGRAYRLYSVDETSGGQSDVIGSDGYLGSTKRETYDALHTLARAWELAANAREHRISDLVAAVSV